MKINKEIRIRDLILVQVIAFILIVIIDTSFELLTLKWSNYNYSEDISMLLIDMITLFILLVMIRPSKEYIKNLFKDYKKCLNIKEIIGRYINSSVINIGLSYLLIGAFILINVNIANEILNTSSAQDILYNGSIIINSISIVVIAPILEEIIYRKVIFKRLYKKTNVVIGIILSSVIFGLGHASDSIVFAILFGVILCILYEKYNNILIPISLHFVNNVMSTILLLISDSRGSSEIIILVQQDSYGFLIIGTIASIIGFYFYIRYIYKNRKYIVNKKSHSFKYVK